MQDCETLNHKTLPPQVVYLQIACERCGFDDALQASMAEARSRDNAPVLLSWYDAIRHTYSPEGEGCTGDKPAWVAYAEEQGADLTISVNNGDFVFIFRKSHGLP